MHPNTPHPHQRDDSKSPTTRKQPRSGTETHTNDPSQTPNTHSNTANMVGTRRSLPNVTSVNPSSSDPNVPKELRRLNIDGKDTMYGTKLQQRFTKPKKGEMPSKKKQQQQDGNSDDESEDEADVYYWRGAAYEATPGTPQEWLDQDPGYWERKARIEAKKARRAAKQTARATGVSSTVSPKETLKRKSTSALDSDTNTQDGDDMARPAKRARRNTVPATTSTNTRLRKPSTNTSSSTHRASNMRSSRPADDDDEEEEDRQNDDGEVDDTLKFDFTAANALRIQSTIAAQKREAQQKGYNLSTYSNKDMKRFRQQKKRQPQMQAAPQVQTQPPPDQRTIGAYLCRDVIRMAKVNETLHPLMQKYQRLKARGVFKDITARKNSLRSAGSKTGSKGKGRRPARVIDEDEDGAEVVSLPPREVSAGAEIPTISVEQSSDSGLAGDDLRLANAVDEVFDERDTQSQIESQINDELNDDDESEITAPSSKRQDSATSATSPDLPPSSHTTPVGDATQIPKTSPAAVLPEKNKAGQRLRWSLGEEPEGRAEGLIHKGRMNGESKAARRRRVQRELKILHSWPIDEEETAKARAAAAATARGE